MLTQKGFYVSFCQEREKKKKKKPELMAHQLYDGSTHSAKVLILKEKSHGLI